MVLGAPPPPPLPGAREPMSKETLRDSVPRSSDDEWWRDDDGRWRWLLLLERWRWLLPLLLLVLWERPPVPPPERAWPGRRFCRAAGVDFDAEADAVAAVAAAPSVDRFGSIELKEDWQSELQHQPRWRVSSRACG